MTFLEAAEAVLKESGVPLHFKEIAKRAQAKGLIQTSGQTPDATMGALLYSAVKKDKESGAQGVFRLADKAQFGLALPTVGQSVQAAIDAQNKKVAREVLEFLLEMHPRQLELVTKRLLVAIGFEAAVTKYVGDGGVDVNATLTVGGVTKVRTAIQVKRFKEGNNIGVKPIRELRGSLVTDERGLFITTSDYADGAIEEAQAPNKVPISLINGSQLVDLLLKHQIGVEREMQAVYRVKLDELLTLEPEDSGGEKFAAIWPLPGGQDSFFESLLAFLDEIGAQKPTLDEMTEWVLKTFEKVTKHKLVEPYLRAVLVPFGLMQFDGDRIVLTPEGETLRSKRERPFLFGLVQKNVLGVTELLELLASGPATVEQVHEHLTKKVGVKWETDAQVKFRLQWLVAAGGIVRDGKGWRLVSGSIPAQPA